MRYRKPPLSIPEQVTLLESRGLLIPDHAKASHYLSNISYYRLRAYTYPFQDNRNPRHPFHAGITFDRVLDNYLFDKSLRVLVFDAIERIEIALRTQIIHQFALSFGSHWHEDPKLYNRVDFFIKDMGHLDHEIKRSSEVFIKHYFRKYTSPPNPPAWMSLEVTSMGLLSKIYENLKINPEKKAIAFHFGLYHPFVLESWMHSFSNLRNICAHHGRLWNRILAQPPKLPKRTQFAWLETPNPDIHKLFVPLSCVVYILNIISPGHHWKDHFKKLLGEFPTIKTSDMGFPLNWQNEPLWQ